MSHLSQKAMLAKLTVCQWSGRKLDKTVSEEIAQKYGAARDVGRYNKNLVLKSALKPIQEIGSKARQDHYTLTLPWLDDGSRILTAKAFQAYSDKQRENRSDWEIAVSGFLDAYEQHIQAAQGELNGLYNPSDYPSRERIERKFSFAVEINPIPDAADWRVSLTSEDTETIRRRITERQQQAQEQAMGDLWTRLHAAVSHLVERLSDDKNVFRDSMIGNIRDLCSLLPDLNITDSPELEAMRKEVENRLAQYEPEELRVKDTAQGKMFASARDQARMDAQKILSKMNGYMGGATDGS